MVSTFEQPVTLVKASGERLEIRATVGKDGGSITKISTPIEDGDVLEYTDARGIKNRLVVSGIHVYEKGLAHISFDLAKALTKTATARNKSIAADNRTVFVVHGRNIEARDGMFTLLRSLNLHPLEWAQAKQRTGKPSPYIGEILQSAFEHAQAILVLLTGDDEARLREDFHKSSDPDIEKRLVPQARPNVLFEAGMAMGREPTRTIIVQIGNLREFSDISGIHVIRINKSPSWRKELVESLKNAQCDVDDTGQDWLTVGSDQFTEALENAVP